MWTIKQLLKETEENRKETLCKDDDLKWMHIFSTYSESVFFFIMKWRAQIDQEGFSEKNV
jgi:hypothetical protein